MSLYARSDMMSVSIPASSGGCGATHTRPVTRGAPAKLWRLDCLPCESYLRGDRKGKVIRVIPGDKDQGIPSRMEHVADSDPHWSTTPEGIPPTPDEQHVNKIRAERGRQELDLLQAFVAMKNAGVAIPESAQWLLDQTFDPRVVKGTTVCALGHDNVAGAKFCAECGMKMETRGLLEEADEPEDEAPAYSGLHIATLRKMARQQGLPDKGTKAQLIERLS